MLCLVEPDDPEQMVRADPGKQVGDLGGACHRPGRVSEIRIGVRVNPRISVMVVPNIDLNVSARR